MIKEKIKVKIREILNEYGDRVLTGFKPFPEFAELASGDYDWTLGLPDGSDSNILVLGGVNQECILAFNELRAAGEIEIGATSLMVVASEGDMYKLPLAKSLRHYKKMHWLPSIVIKGKNFKV